MRSLTRKEKSNVSCRDFREALDFYLDDDLAGVDVRERYPSLWRHLQECAFCRREYEEWRELLARSREGTLKAPVRTSPRPLSFLRPQAREAAWTTWLRSRIGGHPLELRFTFARSYLLGLLAPSCPAFRGAQKPAEKVLLLSEVVPLGQQRSLTVELWAIPEPEGLRIQAVATGSPQLPSKLWATLIWAGEAHTAPLDEKGEVTFEGVSLKQLKEAVREGRETIFSFHLEEREDEAPYEQ